VRGRVSWGLAAGALLVSASAVLIDLAGTSPGTATFYRCLLAVPPLALLAARERGRVPARLWRRAVVAGVLFGADGLLWTQAIAEIGAGLSTVLVNLQVVLVPVLAWLVDREPVTRRFLLAVPVMLVGVVLAAGLFEHGTGRDPVWGTVHASLAAVCYSGFLFLLRRGGQQGPVVAPYVAVTASAAVTSAVVALFWHGLDLAPGWAPLGWLLLSAVCGQVVGWLLVAFCSPRLPSHTGAILLLLTPVGAVALGAVVLHERPTLPQLLGCAVVLGSVALTASGKERGR
jgi:drug/metabolite transporter (DMT)-like permease